MSNGSKTGGRLSRRKMLALTLSGTAAGVAGCLGGGGGGDTTAGGDATTEGDGGDSVGGGTQTTGGSTPASGGGDTTSVTGDSGTTGGDGTSGGDGTTGGNGSEGTPMSPDQMADPTVDMNVEWLPQDANWNHYSDGPLSGFFPFDYTSKTYWNGNTDWWLLKEDGFTYDGENQTTTYEFKEDYGRWWNGDPVTAKDLQIQMEIERLQHPETSAWEEWRLEDEYTLVGVGAGDSKVNPILLGNGSLRVMDYRGAFRQWYEQFKDATTQDERQNTFQEMSTNFKVGTQEFVDKGLANSVYQLSEWSTTEMVWEKFEDHPHADRAPFPTVKWNIGKGSSADQMITNDTLDLGIGKFPQNLKGASPDYLETAYTKRSIQARNLLFNFKDKHIGRRNVRRALVSILDWNRLVNFWGGEGGPVTKRQTGLPQALEDKWLGDDLMNQMHEYSLGSDPEAAKKFMEMAGYSKQNGTWTGPDGEPLKFSLMVGTYGTQEALGQAMSQKWNSWGAKVELKGVTNSQWNGQIFNPSNGWGATIFLHGFDTLNPLNYFQYTNPYHMYLQGEPGSITGWLEEGVENSPVNGRPLKPTIPSEPGALEVGEDGGEQLNQYQLIEDLRVAQEDSESQEIIRKLSRYFNYDLPMFDAFPQVAAAWGDTQDFKWPEDADLWQQKASRAVYETLRKGVLSPASSN